MTTPFFSIVTPTYNRVNDGKLKRCLNSVMTQTFEDFEIIVVDDGSEENVRGLIEDYDDRFRLVRQEHQGRIIARNLGIATAEGEWYVHLDSDDVLDPMYLVTFAYYIKNFPEARLFVGGVVVHGQFRAESGEAIIPKWTKIRPAWSPPPDPEGKFESAIFTSGKVGTGMFVYHSNLAEYATLPPWTHWEQAADGIDDWLGVPPGTTGYSAKHKLIGNPVGDDHCAFQSLARRSKVYLVPAALYVQYIK